MRLQTQISRKRVYVQSHFLKIFEEKSIANNNSCVYGHELCPKVCKLSCQSVIDRFSMRNAIESCKNDKRSGSERAHLILGGASSHCRWPSTSRKGFVYLKIRCRIRCKAHPIGKYLIKTQKGLQVEQAKLISNVKQTDRCRATDWNAMEFCKSSGKI